MNTAIPSNVLAMGVNGDHPGETFTVTYTDGSRAPLLVSLSDWAHPQSYPGEAVALLMAHRITPTGTVAYGPYHLLSADGDNASANAGQIPQDLRGSASWLGIAAL